MKSIDINSDLGEGYGQWRMGDDAAMMALASSVNIACGFHAGDPDIMFETLSLAKTAGVSVGAHPGFADRQGFGRRAMYLSTDEIERLVAYQTGALCGLAALAGTKVTHVKAHGALANMGMKDAGIARAIARGTKGVDASLIALATAGTELIRAAEAEGLVTANEIFVDRAFEDDGTLTPRTEPGAVIHDPDIAAARIEDMLAASAIISRSGKQIPVRIDSLCVHSDTPEAVMLATAVRDRLEASGYTIRPFGR